MNTTSLSNATLVQMQEKLENCITGKMPKVCFIVIYCISEFIIHREVNGALAPDWSIDTTAPP